jgi:hypothetical protein
MRPGPYIYAAPRLARMPASNSFMRVGAGCEDVLLMRLSGSDPSASRRTSVGNGSGLSRGDRNRNARLARLRELVPLGNAIMGIDLADDTQAAVVTDHDSRAIARRRVSVRAWELGDLLDWAVARASEAGFASMTVACEPAGHRWRVLDQLAAGAGPGAGMRAAAAGLPGPGGRGPDPGQVRSQGRGADRAAGQ